MFLSLRHLILFLWILLPAHEAVGNIIIIDDYYSNVRWMFWESQEKMTFSVADSWATELDAEGYTDWELPLTPDGQWDGRTYNQYNNESKINITCSDLGHLYYTVMNYTAVTGQQIPPSSRAPFSQQDFWLRIGDQGQASTHQDSNNSAWVFNFSTGVQALQSLNLTTYALAVRTEPLSASAVPEPNTALLFFTGLLCLTYRPLARKQLS